MEFPNASGLIKGADVLMAGAKIGMVGEKPVILKDMTGVTVPLQIYEGVNVPSASRFAIGSSGLLGDRFIDVIMEPGAAESTPIPAGTVLQGTRNQGMDDITAEATLLIGDLRHAVKKIEGVVTRINSEVLSEATVGNVSATLENLKITSDNFTKASAGLDETLNDARKVMDEIKTAVKTGGEALTSAKGTADEAGKAIEDIRGVIKQARYGKGLLPQLLSNPDIAANMEALVKNLRERGILFYKDTADREQKRRR